MKNRLSTTKEVQLQDMQRYYEFQAKIYDATRWTFLYGRNGILRNIPFDRQSPIKVLEVGCGTGVNLRKLAKLFPKAELLGLDISGDMLNRAEKNLNKFQDRVSLEEKPYDQNTEYMGQFDLILFSYSLSMINPQWKDLLALVPSHLSEQGLVAVVDFHDANFNFYRKFMSSNHVRLEGQLLPVLQDQFETKLCKVKKGLAGVWDYMMFIGGKPQN